MSTARQSIVKIQTLTRSEYNLAKHIPNSNPLRRVPPENDGVSVPVSMCSKPLINKPLLSQFEGQFSTKGQGETVKKGAYVDGPEGMSNREMSLTTERQRLVNELDSLKEELDHLRRQNTILQDEKHIIVNGYEDKIRKLQGQDNIRVELERRIRAMELERERLEEEVNKTRLAKMTLESQFEEFRRRASERDDLDSQLEALAAERNYFENQFKQAKAIQINLEQELRQKADERAKMVSDYEIRIASLQNEIVALRSQKEGDSMRKSQTLVRLQDENVGLAGEVTNLRNLKNSLETQIDRLRGERLSMDDNMRLRMAEIEASNRNSLALLDQERRNSESLRILLQQKSEELLAKETEFANTLQHKLIEIFDLKAQFSKVESADINKVLLMIEIDRLQNLVNDLVQGTRQKDMENLAMKSSWVTQTTDRTRPANEEEIVKRAGAKPQAESAASQEKVAEYELRTVMFMIEIERLGNIVGELQEELGLWRQQALELDGNAAKEIEDAKREYERIMSNRVENEIRNALGKFEADRRSLELQLKGFQSRIHELEDQIKSIKTENEKLQQNNSDTSRELQEWKFKHSQLERGGEALRHSIQGEYRMRLDNQVADLNSKLSQERQQNETQAGQLKKKISDLESKLLLVATENERWTQTVRDRDTEIENWKKRLTNVDQEYRKQMEQLREQLNTSTTQVIDIEIRNKASRLESERTFLEDKLKNSTVKTQSLEDKVDELNREIQRLRKENSENVIKIDELNARVALAGDREKESQYLKEKFEQVRKAHAQELEDLKTQFDTMLRTRIDLELGETRSKLGTEKRQLETQLKNALAQNQELEEKLALLNTETERLRHVIREARDETEHWRMRSEDLEKDLETTRISVDLQVKQAIERELTEINLRAIQEKNQLESQISRLKVKIQDFEIKGVLLMIEIDRLYSVLDEKNKEKEAIKERIGDMEANSANQLEEFKRQFENMFRSRIEIEIREAANKWQREREALDSHINELSSRNKELEDALALTNIERQRMREQMNEKDREMELLNNKLKEAQRQHEQYVDKLRIEIQYTLRAEFENQMKDLTDRFSLERNALENQIRQLKIRIAELEGQLHEAEETNERIAAELRDRHGENEGLRSRFMELERNADNNMRDLQEKMEKQKLAEVDEVMRKATASSQIERMALESQNLGLQQKLQEYENKFALLSAEIKRLTDLNMDRNNELEEMKIQYGSLEKNAQIRMEQMRVQLEIQHRNEKETIISDLSNRFAQEKQDYENQLRGFRQQIIEYENKVILLTNEIERLNAALKDKAQEIELWKGKLATLERVKSQELEEARQRAEIDKKIAIDQKINELTNKFKVEKAQLEAKVKELRGRNIELENKMTFFKVEIERLNTLYDDRTREVDTWKDKYAQLENSRFIEIEEVRTQFETLKRSSLQMSDYEIRFQAERSSYETQIMQMKHKIAELEATVFDYNKEIERLNGLYTETKKQAEAFRNRYGSLDQSSVGELDLLRKENENLKKSIWEKDETNVRFEVEKTNYENQITQLKQIIEANKSEMNKLYNLINTRKGESDNSTRQLNIAREDSAKYSRLHKELEAEYKMLLSQHDQLKKEAQNLQRSRDIYKSQLEEQHIDITKKNKELIEKIQEVDALKAKYQEALANVNPITTSTTSKVITRVSLNQGYGSDMNK